MNKSELHITHMDDSTTVVVFRFDKEEGDRDDLDWGGPQWWRTDSIGIFVSYGSKRIRRMFPWQNIKDYTVIPSMAFKKIDEVEEHEEGCKYAKGFGPCNCRIGSKHKSKTKLVKCVAGVKGPEPRHNDECRYVNNEGTCDCDYKYIIPVATDEN